MPTILDHWTSGRDAAARQRVFRPGQALRFNALVQGNPADPTQRIRLVFIIESEINGFVVVDSGSYEVIYRPQAVPDGTFTIGGSPAHASLLFESIPAGPHTVVGRDRTEMTRALATGAGTQIFTPALWSFRVYIAELDPADRPFALSETWNYEILA